MSERPRRASARSRILVWIMVPVTVAVAIMVVITGGVLSARIDALLELNWRTRGTTSDPLPQAVTR